MILKKYPQHVWRKCLVTSPVSTASASQIDAGSYSDGTMKILKKFALLIITKQKNMKKLSNIHPGEILAEEYLKPLKISAYRLSLDIGIPQSRTSEILKKRRSITADTALRLGKYFGNSPKFWLGLQNDYDLEETKKVINNELGQI